VHAYCVRLGLLADDGGVIVACSLVYMCAKCGVDADTVKVFEEMLKRDVVTWTMVVSRCMRNGEYLMGLRYPPHLVAISLPKPF
jgi:hypothetical protein